MEKNTNNYVIKEIFYSNGVTFRKERFNKETGEEITQYFSKNGEIIEKSKYKNGELKKRILERIIKKLKCLRLFLYFYY